MINTRLTIRLRLAMTLSMMQLKCRRGILLTGFLPDKAIDLIDEAASRVRLKAYTAPDNIKAMEKEVKSLEEEKTSAVRSQDLNRRLNFVIRKRI